MQSNLILNAAEASITLKFIFVLILFISATCHLVLQLLLSFSLFWAGKQAIGGRQCLYMAIYISPRLSLKADSKSRKHSCMHFTNLLNPSLTLFHKGHVSLDLKYFFFSRRHYSADGIALYNPNVCEFNVSKRNVA